MRTKLIVAIFFSLILASPACQTKKFTLLDYPEKIIVFGSGGGFAGTVTEYCIFENGQCFLKKPGEKKFNAIAGIDQNVAKQVFNNYITLDLANIKLKSPGNMYYFVKHGKKDKMYELVWGAYGQSPPNKLKSYYDFLNSIINSQPAR